MSGTLPFPGGAGRRASLPWGALAVAGAVALIGFVVWSLLSAQIVTRRPNEMKTTQVILPPPPPPPPPPEPRPQQKPPEPTRAPPIEQPADTPPPPQPAAPSAAAPGDQALTAREGAGPSNYGLGVGDGSGTRIGGRPGGAGGSGDGFAAYAGQIRTAIQLATQADRELARGRYDAGLEITVDPETGRITDLRVVDSSGDSRRDARLRRVLVGLQLPRRPPPGLPRVRIKLNARPTA